MLMQICLDLLVFRGRISSKQTGGETKAARNGSHAGGRQRCSAAAAGLILLALLAHVPTPHGTQPATKPRTRY